MVKRAESLSDRKQEKRGGVLLIKNFPLQFFLPTLGQGKKKESKSFCHGGKGRGGRSISWKRGELPTRS